MNLPRKLAISMALLLMGGLLFQGCTVKSRGYRFAAPCSQVKKRPVVAVLMFRNKSSWEGADGIIETLFVSTLIDIGYRVVEPANVKKIYITSKVSDISTAITRVIDPLSAQYKAQYFITGSVQGYGYQEDGKRRIPFVSLNVRMLDRKKDIVWKAYLETKGTDSELAFTVGEIRTPDRLAGLNIRRLVSKLCLSKQAREKP